LANKKIEVDKNLGVLAAYQDLATEKASGKSKIFYPSCSFDN
jgi:hypothetical protein